MVQKVYGGEKPVPIWLEDTEETDNTDVKRILFSLVVRVKASYILSNYLSINNVAEYY